MTAGLETSSQATQGHQTAERLQHYVRGVHAWLGGDLKGAFWIDDHIPRHHAMTADDASQTPGCGPIRVQGTLPLRDVRRGWGVPCCGGGV